MKKIKGAVISDTHKFHRQVKIPKVDLLLVAGDISNKGERDIIEDFERWCGELKADGTVKEIVVICGNHELYLDQDHYMFNQNTKDILINSTNLHYLEGDSIELFGYKIQGFPDTPEFGNWAWNRKRGAELQNIWKSIEDDVDILITHGPIYDVADFIPEDWNWQPGMLIDMSNVRRVGCQDLAERVDQLENLKLFACGHIHCARGIYDRKENKFDQLSIDLTSDKIKKPIFVNASICNERYQPVNPVLTFEI